MGHSASVVSTRTLSSISFKSGSSGRNSKITTVKVLPFSASDLSMEADGPTKESYASVRHVVPIPLLDDSDDENTVSTSVSTTPVVRIPAPPPPHAMFHPTMLMFLTCREISRVMVTCKRWKDTAFSEETWFSVCVAAAAEYQLFLPRTGVSSWKRLFFDHVWPARNKWSGFTVHNAFNIQVAVRFKPGDRSDTRLVLPLHQRLKLRKKGEEFLEKEPVEFLDAMMNTVMCDPVKLPSSQRVMDRAVIAQHVKRFGKDPFTQAALSMSDVIPLPELREKIMKWKAERTGEGKLRDVVAVSASALGQAVTEDGGDLPIEVMEALIEAEKLVSASRRAEEEMKREAMEQRWRTSLQRPYQRPGGGDGGGVASNSEEEDDELGEEFVDDLETLTTGVDGTGNTIAQSDDDDAANNKPDTVSSTTDDGSGKRYKESPKVLAIQNSRVMTYVPGAGMRPFLFSRVFNGDADQGLVYGETAHKVVVDVLNGFNACLLCYGQTGSGKTHTMFGPDGELARLYASTSTTLDVTRAGVAVRACNELLSLSCGGQSLLACSGVSPSTANVSMQYIEIYQNTVTDLLTGRPVHVSVFGDNVVLAGAMEAHLSTPNEAFHHLLVGEARKQRAATAMNDRSSRAHTVLLLTVTQRREGSDALVRSHLYLVDLAGSERIKKSKAVGTRKTEAVGINSSLLVLGKCISSLVEGKSHIPYNESKLTMVLKAAFGGNSRTTAIVTCHSDDVHADETLQSLRFGERCSMVTNQTVMASTSLSGALTLIDTSLKQCASRIEALEKQGRTHLEVYSTLVAKYEQLLRRRREIQGQTDAEPTTVTVTTK